MPTGIRSRRHQFENSGVSTLIRFSGRDQTALPVGCRFVTGTRRGLQSAMANDRIKLGVLWKHDGKDGKKPFLSGAVRAESMEAAIALMRDGGRLLVLSNVGKRPDKRDPDCELFVVPSNPPKGD